MAVARAALEETPVSSPSNEHRSGSRKPAKR
jgi:hypothetical protein